MVVLNATYYLHLHMDLFAYIFLIYVFTHHRCMFIISFILIIVYIYVFFQLDVYIIGMYACGGAMLSISFIVCTCCFGWFQLLHFRPNVFGVFYVCTHVN